MGRRDGMTRRKCGCIQFEYGPPVKCDKHQAKEKVKEVRTVRQLAANQSFELGHDLSVFKEYASTRGKWTAFCHTCGAFAIVYDDVPVRGDQLAGAALFKPCGGHSGLAILAGTGDEGLH